VGEGDLAAVQDDGEVIREFAAGEDDDHGLLGGEKTAAFRQRRGEDGGTPLK
jgi:hypothetical protein